MKKILNKFGSAAVTTAMAYVLLSGGIAGVAQKPPADVKAWEPSDRLAPTIDQLRADIFMPHYARIQGMFDGLSEDIPMSLDLIHDMGRLHVRFMDLEVLADEGIYATSLEEGLRLSEDGQVTPDGLNGYIRAVLASDSKIREQWFSTTREMEADGLSLEDANYLALLAMAPDQEVFLSSYTSTGIAGMMDIEDNLPLISLNSYRAASETAKTIFEHLDQALLGQEPHQSNEFAMDM